MSKVLKRLYLGDVVKSFGTKQLRKLTTEKPQEDSIVGTWVFNDTVNISSDFEDGYNISFVCDNRDYVYLEVWAEDNQLIFGTGTLNNPDNFIVVYDNVEWVNDVYKTITIIGYNDPNISTFITWLKANATKQ